jgi:hypothetical protein
MKRYKFSVSQFDKSSNLMSSFFVTVRSSDYKKAVPRVYRLAREVMSSQYDEEHLTVRFDGVEALYP